MIVGEKSCPKTALKCLDDINESVFKSGCKLHAYELRLESVIHYVVMGRSCLHRDIVTDVINGRGVILLSRVVFSPHGPRAVRRFGSVWVEQEFVSLLPDR